MNSENQFETIILKILESDPQLLVAASVVLVILIVIGVFFVKTLKKLFSDETQTPPLSEKDRLKKLEELAKEEEELREQRDEAKLQKISEKEDSAKLELQQKEAQLRERQILQRDIPVEVEPEAEESPTGFLDQLKLGVQKTREQLLKTIGETLQGKKEIDEELLDDLEEALLGADLGPETCERVIKVITEKVERKELKDPEVLQQAIKTEISNILDKQYPEVGTSDAKPLVLLMVGVNGVGKTTTIGKIASQYVEDGKQVLLGAGDTFRAAAIELLQQWAERAGCDFVSKEAGSD
ncbi:MAG: signal recognition particle receptor subunit alpha, partial [Deltaproteobacteria bacterium]